MTVFNEATLPSYLIPVKESIYKYWGWYLTLGILLIFLGILAISTAVFTTLVSVIFCGGILVAGGIAMFFHAARFWQDSKRVFFFTLLLGGLYLLAGAFILYNPLLGAISLAMALGTFYLFVGISRIILALDQPIPAWGWMLVNGIICVFLGGFIWFYWPVTSLWLLGIIVGTDLIFIGWWLAMLGWSSHKYLSVLNKKLS